MRAEPGTWGPSLGHPGRAWGGLLACRAPHLHSRDPPTGRPGPGAGSEMVTQVGSPGDEVPLGRSWSGWGAPLSTCFNAAQGPGPDLPCCRDPHLPLQPLLNAGASPTVTVRVPLPGTWPGVPPGSHPCLTTTPSPFLLPSLPSQPLPQWLLGLPSGDRVWERLWPWPGAEQPHGDEGEGALVCLQRAEAVRPPLTPPISVCLRGCL